MNCATHQLEVFQYGLYSHRCVFSSNIMLDWNIFDPKQGRSYSWAGRVFIGGAACIYTTPNYHRIFNSQVSSSAIFWAGLFAPGFIYWSPRDWHRFGNTQVKTWNLWDAGMRRVALAFQHFIWVRNFIRVRNVGLIWRVCCWLIPSGVPAVNDDALGGVWDGFAAWCPRGSPALSVLNTLPLNIKNNHGFYFQLLLAFALIS